MSEFQAAVDGVLKIEGGYSDRAADRGGATNFGITERLARQYGYQGNMLDLPRDKAIDIYRREFWDPLNLDNEVSQTVAETLFQMAVNSGPGFARQARAMAVTLDPERAKLCVAQMKHYLDIVQKDPGQLANLHGWANRAVAYALAKEE
jgi:lysozyme family protein